MPIARTSRRALIAIASAGALVAAGSALGVQGPLHTSGGQIVDQANREVVLQGVNWFGFETANHAPHGLWTRDHRSPVGRRHRYGISASYGCSAPG